MSTKKVAKLLKINKKVWVGENLIMYVIVVYVPVDHVSNVVTAMLESGAGEVGNYRACAFQQKGIGQFQPMPGADPFIGTVGELEVLEEVRLEMVCTAANIRVALQAMMAAHPYEEVAYHVLEAKTLADFSD
ncbi:MAG: hypothetical protein P8X74_09200 [Reinekea sp.]